MAALATVIVAAIPKARRHYAPLALVLAVVALGFVGLAQGSGEALEERVTETELLHQHTSQGESVLPWAMAVVVVAAAVAAATRIRRWRPAISARALSAVLVLAAVIASVGATWAVIDVGHSGATAAWDDEPAAGEHSGVDSVDGHAD